MLKGTTRELTAISLSPGVLTCAEAPQRTAVICSLVWFGSPPQGPGRGTEGIWYKEGWREDSGCWRDSGSPSASVTLNLSHRQHTGSGARQHAREGLTVEPEGEKHFCRLCQHLWTRRGSRVPTKPTPRVTPAKGLRAQPLRKGRHGPATCGGGVALLVQPQLIGSGVTT